MMQAAASASPVVFVVDDDFDVREVLKSLLESVGLRAEVFGSTREFLQHKPMDTVSCLVLDVSLPGVSGLDFQAELAGTHADIPIIFLSGHDDDTDVGQGHEGRRGRIPHQAGARAGSVRCHQRGFRT